MLVFLVNSEFVAYMSVHHSLSITGRTLKLHRLSKD